MVGALAGNPCRAGGVSMRSQDSRALVSPCKHVGEHSDGVAGWRAAWGSGGIAGGLTAGGGNGGELAAQPVSSSPSSSSIGQGLGLTFSGFIGNLLHGALAPVLLLARLGLGLVGGGGHGGELLRMLLAGLGVGHALAGKLEGLEDRQHSDDGQGDGERAGEHQASPAVAGASLMVRSISTESGTASGQR